MPKTGGAADSGDGTEDLVWGTTAGTGDKARDHDLEIQPTGDITNGLIRIGGTSRTGGKLPTLGQELSWEDGRWKDRHNTTTRIFGHYHLAWADQEDRKVKAMNMNSYSGTGLQGRSRQRPAGIQHRRPAHYPEKSAVWSRDHPA